MSKVADCQKLLIAESEKKGFLTFDDILPTILKKTTVGKLCLCHKN